MDILLRSISLSKLICFLTSYSLFQWCLLLMLCCHWWIGMWLASSILVERFVHFLDYSYTLNPEYIDLAVNSYYINESLFAFQKQQWNAEHLIPLQVDNFLKFFVEWASYFRKICWRGYFQTSHILKNNNKSYIKKNNNKSYIKTKQNMIIWSAIVCHITIAWKQ